MDQVIERLVPATSESRAPSATKSRKSSLKPESAKQSPKEANETKQETPPAKEVDPFDNTENINRFAAMGKQALENAQANESL